MPSTTMKAILEQHDITVLIGDGKPVGDEEVLPAYKYDDTLEDDTPERTEQCWIPAKPGSNFCVHYAWNGKAKSAPDKEAGLLCRVYIDGWLVSQTFLPLRDIDDESGKNREMEVSGICYDDPRGPTERPFVFKETPTGVGVNELDTSGKGTIQVLIDWATTDFDKSQRRSVSPVASKEDMEQLALNLEAPIHSGDERFMSCVGFGDPIKVEAPDGEFEWLDCDDPSYAFLFHYAHPDWLVRQGIIPPKVSGIYRTRANA